MNTSFKFSVVLVLYVSMVLTTTSHEGSLFMNGFQEYSHICDSYFLFIYDLNTLDSLFQLRILQISYHTIIGSQNKHRVEMMEFVIQYI